MRRVTAPGGPHVSHVKKRRVAELKNAYGNDGPQPSGQSQQQQQSQQGERSSSGAPSSSGQAAAGPAAVKFPYMPLDPGLRDSQLFSYFKNVDTEAAEAANEATAATSHLPKWVLAKNATPVSRGYVEVFVEGLLATNKGQSADSLAAAAMKLVDRTIQLDNPVKAGSAAAQAGLSRQGRVGYCTQLVKRVKGSGSVVSHLKHSHKRHKSAVSYAQLQQLHDMWKAYVAGILPEQPSAGKANNGNNNGAGSSGTNAASNAGGGAGVSEDRLLASAELRGCLVRVLRARDTRHVGLQGIVAALTKNVVCVVDASDNLHVVPLKGCMVQYDAPGNRVVTLNLSSDRR